MSSRHRFAARHSGRRLAVPFVTTVFLGATACATHTAPPKPATTKPATTKPATTKTSSAPTATSPALIPPIPPIPQSPQDPQGPKGQGPADQSGGAGGQSATDMWPRAANLPASHGYVTYNLDGTCLGTEKFSCPTVLPGKLKPTCNPPPPRTVQCPATPSPIEIADARKQTLRSLATCIPSGSVFKTFSVDITAAGKVDQVYADSKASKATLKCVRDGLAKLGWPLHTSSYQIEIK